MVIVYSVETLLKLETIFSLNAHFLRDLGGKLWLFALSLILVSARRIYWSGVLCT
jgi:hypothetical protein